MLTEDPEALADIARRRIASTPGFSDLSDFYVIFYYEEDFDEADEDAKNWVGQYVHGSLESERGLTIAINLTAFEDSDSNGVIDTIWHEIGHALWTLIDKKDQKLWQRKHRDVRWGPEEAFADDFMYLMAGSTYLMTDEELFLKISASGAK